MWLAECMILCTNMHRATDLGDFKATSLPKTVLNHHLVKKHPRLSSLPKTAPFRYSYSSANTVPFNTREHTLDEGLALWSQYYGLGFLAMMYPRATLDVCPLIDGGSPLLAIQF